MVRNEEALIADALQSVHPVADQIVVVDVGSTDRTAEIAGGLGAEVYSFDDPDDFAAARNESLRHADGDWILVLDGDERLDPSSFDGLRAIVAREDFAGFLVRIINYTDREGTEGHIEHRTLRLFPNDPDLRYEGADPHAQIVNASRDRVLALQPAEIVLHHEGYRPQHMEDGSKLDRNLRALELAVADDPGNTFHLFNLGLTLSLLGRPADAERELLRAVALAGVDVHRGEPPLFLANAYVALAAAVIAQGRFSEGVSYCESALRVAPGFPDAHLTLGSALAELGRSEEALAAFGDALGSTVDTTMAATDHSTSTWKPLLGMAEVYAQQGRWDDATACLNEAHRLAPESPDVALSVARASLSNGDIEAAAAVLEAVAARDDAPPHTWLLLADVADLRGDHETAKEHLRTGIARRPLQEALYRDRMEAPAEP
jgi:tetratricopeptide (TPR) repeat protein